MHRLFGLLACALLVAGSGWMPGEIAGMVEPMGATLDSARVRPGSETPPSHPGVLGVAPEISVEDGSRVPGPRRSRSFDSLPPFRGPKAPGGRLAASLPLTGHLLSLHSSPIRAAIPPPPSSRF